ncbi:hypothetical protein FHW00_004639 [Ochrobactrum sp. P6BSIII]|nr:hypothetical protein [Ochrobactrum sp. P6BSIII]
MTSDLITRLSKLDAPDRDFERVAVDYFTNEVGHGYSQRIDGIECFSPLPRYWFWRFRLNRLVSKGILQRRYFGSFWPSCSRLPSYGIALLRAKDAS